MASLTDLTGLLEWRCIGPFRGGRVVAVAGDQSDPSTFYFGAVAGGVWKTTDGGTYWECVSDGYLTTSSIGALAIAPSDANVIYAGTGETTIRIDVSHGDGIYRSSDAGRTWQRRGLADTRHIGKIRIDPTDPDTVYVAALGHAFGPHAERGVYKSTDGGQSWRQVLSVSDRAGAVDLSLDMTNPRILYAALWEVYRNFWQISSGGPGSGLWQSTDGGESWRDLSDRPGLPAGLKGKIGVAASPARSGRVWALIEHLTAGGLYRSDDHGESWERVCADQNLISRAWYYTHITADPVDAETVYINNLAFWQSTDGGRTFSQIATPHGDNHDLWIDPRDNRRMIQGNDGGANVSFNGGLTWSTIYNQPTAQFYHLAVDNRQPYIVYGTQQDNSSVAVPSRSARPGIAWSDCFIAGTGESGYIAVRPDDPNIVYVGAIGSSPGGGNCLQRYDHRNQQIRLITTWPESTSGQGAAEHRYRFAWTYPIIISPHDPNTLYIGGNMVFRSTNEGQSWEPISPDLTRADPATLGPTGGPINRDSVGAEVYATVFALVESPHERGVFWAGSDDGLVHLSTDGGGSWRAITPPTLPEWSLISCIELSPHDRNTAYLAATRYKLDDYQPYLYRTTDHGQTWSRIDSGIARDAFTRVIRADPNRPGLLYAGTEVGLYCSFDNGQSWQPFQLNLPITPLHDLLVKETDLIAGTHGRSIWILDDLTPLYQLAAAITEAPVHLFRPRPTLRTASASLDWMEVVPGKNYLSATAGAFTATKRPDGSFARKPLDIGQNPPSGVIITYLLKERPTAPIELRIADERGELIQRLVSASSPSADDKPGEGTPASTPPREPLLPAAAGWNRFVWNMRYPYVKAIEGSDPAAEQKHQGPLVAPGRYQLTLTVGEHQLSEWCEIIKDPSSSASQADLQAQFELNRRIYEQLNATVAAINQMRDLRAQLSGWRKRGAGLGNGATIVTAAEELHNRILEIEKTIVIPDLRSGWADNLNQGVRLLEKLAGLPAVVSMGDYRPTDAAYAVFEELSGRINRQIGAFNTLLANDLPALNERIASAALGALVVSTGGG